MKSYPRRFVAADADMGDWTQIEPYFQRLADAPIDTPAQLEQWLLDGSELTACIGQERVSREVAMTCATDDPQREQAFLEYIEHIQPKIRPWVFRLQQKYTASPARKKLPQDRYLVLDRSTLNAVELFREENVPLQTEEEKLQQQYQKVCGAMTVQYQGREHTLQQMAPYQLETDRRVRQEAWETVTRRRLADREAIDDIFDKLVALRHRMAVNAGFDDYRAYTFRLKERFDYTPEDCERFHMAIEQVCVPLLREIQQRRRAALGVETLRPWDLAVDVKGRAPLRPFAAVDELCDGCHDIFVRVDPALAAQFDTMRRSGWLDLDSRKGKAPGGYQETYFEERRPFIFMNAVGLHRDVETLLHEGGHAFHTFATRDEPLITYRHAPIEFCEVASMSMELLAMDRLDRFYTGENLHRAQREQLESLVAVFPWIATIDAFQHWVYLHPQHTRDERRRCWLDLHRRFGGTESYAGYEDALAWMWQRQLHPFLVPFYYVEYGIAQIGALQVWQNARKDFAGAVARYRAALALGGSRPLPELFTAAGIRFDFTADTLRPLIDDVRCTLDGLRD